MSSYPALDGKIAISTDGGVEPRWSRDVRTLFYRNGDRMMAVTLTSESSLRVGAPRALFEGRYQVSDTGS